VRISAITQPLQSEIRKVDGSRRAEKEQKLKAAQLDKSEISSKGQRLSETSEQISLITSQVVGQPDVRSDKVAEVQEKIKNGYYDSPDFIDKLATKLMQEFGLGGTTNV
jgi:anti-sigma28 factor (negative regulator of flagellin synthesis)